MSNQDKPLISFRGQLGAPTKAFSLGGVLFDIGTKVTKWYEPGGFSLYDTNRVQWEEEDRRTGRRVKKQIAGRRYSKRRGGLGAIRQFFIHHSGGDGPTPAGMFETLHNRRKLSVHFAVEDDGRIWQFGDGEVCAWHAGSHNPFSIGVECALYPLAEERPNFYGPKRRERTGNLPHQVVEDTIHGRPMRVFTFTEPQIEALARLAAGNWLALLVLRGFDALPLEDLFSSSGPLAQAPTFPRNQHGEIPRTVYQRHAEHVGLIGHLQCTARKIDPAGFQWERFEGMVAEYYRQFRGALRLGDLG